MKCKDCHSRDCRIERGASRVRSGIAAYYAPRPIVYVKCVDCDIEIKRVSNIKRCSPCRIAERRQVRARWKAKNPGYRWKGKSRADRLYREANASRLRANKRIYYINNRAKIIEKSGRWNIAHPIKRRSIVARSNYRRRDRFTSEPILKLTPWLAR